ncbi:MAG: Lrp/AsnC family transcriptional regulator [Geminicoccaceae bacterium]
MEKVDHIDIRILDQLQQDCSLPMAELADKVGLSTSPCWRRVRRMQESGLIKGQTAQLERQSLGLGFVVYAFIKLATPTREALNQFEAIMQAWPEVMLCECMTGAADFLIKVVTTDVQAYDRFLRDKLLATALVADVQSRIVVHTAKDTTRLPLPDPTEDR